MEDADRQPIEFERPETLLPIEPAKREEILRTLESAAPIEVNDGQWLTDKMIAARLGFDEQTVHNIFDVLGIEPRFIGAGQQSRIAYTYEGLVRLNHEIAWRKLPAHVGITQIAEALGRARPTVRRLIEELDIEPSGHELRAGKQLPRYAKESIGLILDYDRARYPSGENWLRVSELLEAVDFNRTWVINRLAEAGIKPQQRRSVLSGKVLPHFPPESLDVITAAAETVNQAGTDWLTSEDIQRETEKSDNWVNRRLQQYLGSSTIALDSTRRQQRFYPPWVLDELRQELSELTETPEAGEYMTAAGMAKALGKSTRWVARYLQPFEEVAQTRKDRKGRRKTYYPPAVFEALRRELDTQSSYPEAGDYLTITELAEAVGRSRKWTKQQLGKLAVEGELRRDKKGELRPHYPPETVNVLPSQD